MAKATQKQALGRGLSALLKDPANDIQSAQDKNAAQLIGSIVELDINSIEVNPFQPRTQFNDQNLSELASSIKELGIIQPITVRKVGFEKFQLISGERRLRAAKLAGLQTVPSFVRIANDTESLEIALVENIQRQDLDPIEIALSYERLLSEINLTQEQLSDRVGKNRSTIANYLRLLKLDPIIQTGMRDGFVSMGHGRALIGLADTNQQLTVYDKVIANGLSVRQTEDLVRKLTDPKSAEKTRVSSKSFTETAKKMSQSLGRPVHITVKADGKGKLTITFESPKDLAELKKILTGES